MKIDEIMRLGPVIPVLTINQLAYAVPLARALLAGGVRVLEVTLRTSDSLSAIQLIRQEVPEVIVGVGTLTRSEEFLAAQAVGAQFGVSPGITAELAAASRKVSFPLMPGVMTPTDVISARAEGFRALKFFPAEQAGGIAMLQAFAPVFPNITFCPTGGIHRTMVTKYLALPNVACVGGSWIVPNDMLNAADWHGIQLLARDAASLKAMTQMPTQS